MNELEGDASIVSRTSQDGRRITIIIQLPPHLGALQTSRIAGACVSSVTSELLNKWTSQG